jgi:hypothetical protein
LWLCEITTDSSAPVEVSFKRWQPSSKSESRQTTKC